MGNTKSKSGKPKGTTILDGVIRGWIVQAGLELHNAIQKRITHCLLAGELGLDANGDTAIAYGNSIADAFSVACIGGREQGTFFKLRDEDGFGEEQKALDLAWKGKSDQCFKGDTGLLLRAAMNAAVQAKFKSGEFKTDEDAMAFGKIITAAFVEAHKDAKPESSYESGCDFECLFYTKLITDGSEFSAVLPLDPVTDKPKY